MGKRIGLIIGIIIVIAAVGVGAFYGGTVYAQTQINNTRTAFFNGRGGNGGGGNGGGGGGRGGLFGTIKSVNGNTIQVSTAQNVTTVTFTGSTMIVKTVNGTVADLQPGQNVTVRGQADASGNVTANTIQVVPPGSFPGRGGPGGADQTPTPGK